MGLSTHHGLSKYQVLTFWDLDLWSPDMHINRDHQLIKDYLPTKFDPSRTKWSWVINCTRNRRQTWPLTFTFDLLTWISIGIIYSSRTIYLPSLNILEQSILELSVAQGEVDWHDLWPTDLNINRDHLLIKDYQPTKFEACRAKHSWVIYLPSLSLLGHSVLQWSIAQGEVDWHDLDLWPDYQ